MKATGIVRRIDELGRVVIPMEIRRTMKIREGDPLEIFTDSNGELILRKYSPMESIEGYAVFLADSIAETVETGVIICDKDVIVAVSNLPKKEYIGQNITAELEQAIENRKTILNVSKDKLVKIKFDDNAYRSQVIAPILAAGDTYGAVVLVSKDRVLAEPELKVATSAANYLGKQLT
ncbi:MAG: AbrB/MazE/SpoVT family DNA-binding domain-containing protein [Clostridiales bacterium]|nr:AbrB/MazE/SpoVT family DNA-binding domain-containing protein [Clostridiales bacterium]